MKLEDIAYITLGYAFRAAIIPDENGNVLILQPKDLVQGVPVTDTTSLIPISGNSPAHAGHLKKNDILLVSRGVKSGSFRSAVFKSDATNVIATSSIHIIRLLSPDVLPEYISHYLNSRDGQNSLLSIVSGSYIGAIPKKELEKINIPIPKVSKQKAIVDLYNNIQAQQKILDRNKELKQQIIEATFNNIKKHHD